MPVIVDPSPARHKAYQTCILYSHPSSANRQRIRFYTSLLWINDTNCTASRSSYCQIPRLIQGRTLLPFCRVWIETGLHSAERHNENSVFLLFGSLVQFNAVCLLNIATPTFLSLSMRVTLILNFSMLS